MRIALAYVLSTALLGLTTVGVFFLWRHLALCMLCLAMSALCHIVLGIHTLDRAVAIPPSPAVKLTLATGAAALNVLFAFGLMDVLAISIDETTALTLLLASVAHVGATANLWDRFRGHPESDGSLPP